MRSYSIHCVDIRDGRRVTMAGGVGSREEVRSKFLAEKPWFLRLTQVRRDT